MGGLAKSKRSDPVTGAEQSNKQPDVIEISDLIGHWGNYQLQIFLFKIIIGITSAFNNLGVTFAAPQTYVSYWCASGNITIPYAPIKTELVKECRLANGTKCTEWIYDIGPWRSTMIEEWHLVCDRSWLISLSQSAYMASFILAFLLFGPLSDRHGRFPSLLLGASLEVIGGLGCAVSNSVTMFIVFRFLLGFGCAGRSSSSYLIMIEWVGRKYRMQISALGSLGWVIGYCIMPWIVRYFMHFRTFQLFVCGFETLLIIWLLTLPESPRWLLTHKKSDKARQVLLKAAKINNYCLDNFDAKFREFEHEISGKKFDINEHKLTMIDLFRWPNLRIYTIILLLVWGCNSFIYYGIALRMSDFGTNLFVDFTIAGITELPSMFFSILCMKLMPRRTTNLVIFITTGACCALMLPMKHYNIELGLTALAMINKMLISIAFISVLYQTIEIYPTTVRQTASSACQLAGRIGSALAPFIKEFASITHQLVPLIVYAGMAFLCAAIILLLPETKGIEIPDTMEEAENVEKRISSKRQHVTLN